MAFMVMKGTYIMKELVITLLLLGATSFSLATEPKKVITFQTVPGRSTRDWGAPARITEGNVTYLTIPGTTTRDWSAPIWVTKDGVTYQTIPGTATRDWGAPSYKTESR